MRAQSYLTTFPIHVHEFGQPKADEHFTVRTRQSRGGDNKQTREKAITRILVGIVETKKMRKVYS